MKINVVPIIENVEDRKHFETASVIRYGYPSPSDAAKLLSFFVNRSDVFTGQPPWGYSCPAVLEEPELWWLAHMTGTAERELKGEWRWKTGRKPIAGPIRMGVYLQSVTNTCRCICIDFDGGSEHSAPLANPKEAALNCLENLRAFGVACYLERSASGRGYHLWVFFSEPIPAELARRFGLWAVSDEYLLSDGSFANPEKGLGIEIFPKTSRLTSNGVGSAVWLPWYYRSKLACGIFLERGSEGRLRPLVPASFEQVAPAKIEELLASTTTTTAPVKAEPPTKPTSKSEPKDWASKAMAVIDLAEIYGDLLTGKEQSPGWLECRDPESPTGDRKPSAGVADSVKDALRGTFHSFRDGRNRSPFEILVDLGKATTIEDAHRFVADKSGVPLAPGALITGAARAVGSWLPAVIIAGRQLREIEDDMWESIEAANTGTPKLFRRHGDLVRLHMRGGSWMIEPVMNDWLVTYMTRIADFFSGGKEPVAVLPPRDICKGLIANPSGELPELEAIITTPTFGADARIINTPGYNPDAKLFYAPPPDWAMPPVPEKPTKEDIARARSLFEDDAFVDFPFVGPADRAIAVAMTLLAFARRLVIGPTPIHLIEAPTPGCGKTLIARLGCIIATGEEIEATTLADSEDENRKKLTAELSRGRPFILLDNVDFLDSAGKLHSPTLASIISSPIWKDRILGRTKMVVMPNLAVWIMTGNNPRLSMELARRAVRCRIDPKAEHPWQRKGFKHEEIAKWLMENRAVLVHASLTLIQAWIAEGKPEFRREVLGSFENWSKVIGGILEVAGIPGFLDNLTDLYAEVDAEQGGWEEFIPIWWDEFRETPQGATALLKLAQRTGKLLEVRGSTGGERAEQTRMGNGLVRIRDRVISGFRVTLAADKGHKGKQYRLVRSSGIVEVDLIEDAPDISEEKPEASTTAAPPAEKNQSAGGSPTSPSPFSFEDLLELDSGNPGEPRNESLAEPNAKKPEGEP